MSTNTINTTSPTFVEFIPDSNKTDKKNRQDVLMDLQLNYPSLVNAIKDKKCNDKIKLNFCRPLQKMSDLPDYWVVTVQCHNDKVLNYLAKNYNMPRGLHLIWSPGSPITQIAGFLPKFENDDCQPVIDKSLMDHLGEPNNKISITLKYSGSLGLFMVYTIQDHVFCTAFSKNNANCESGYVQAMHNEFKKQLTNIPGLAHQMLTLNLPVIAVECMLKDDQVHGARMVCENNAIVVTVGFKQKYNDVVPCPVHPDWKNIALGLGLPVDLGYTLDGGENAQILMQQLNDVRDFLTFDQMDKLLEPFRTTQDNENKNDHSKAIPVCHKTILGDVLEGLVIIIRDVHDNIVYIFKFKLPNYTFRTMLLRPFFDYYINGKVTGCIANSVYNFVTHFCERWCVTYEGKVFWFRVAMTIFQLYDSGLLMPMIQEEYITTGIGHHILAMETIGKWPIVFASADPPFHWYCCETEKRNDEIDFDTRSAIVIVGPIGSGKSTLGDALVEKNEPGKFQHIDGDHFTQNLEKMGENRGHVTIDKILKVISTGKIPIISCGGGVLFKSNGILTLKEALKRMRFKLDLTVVVVSNNKWPSSPTVEDVEKIYQKTDIVEATLQWRIKQGIWPESVCVNKVAQNSAKNVEFAKRLIKFSEHVFYQYVPMKDESTVLDLNDAMINYISQIPTPHALIDSINKTYQKMWMERYAVYCPIGQNGLKGHITTYHPNDKEKRYSDTYNLPCVDDNPLIIQGTLIEMSIPLVRKNDEKENKNIQIIKLIHLPELFKGAHITISPGPFENGKMYSIALSLCEGKDSVSLITRKGEVIDVTFINMKTKPIDVHLLYGPFKVYV